MSPTPPRPRRQRPKRLTPAFLSKAVKAFTDAGLNITRVDVDPESGKVSFAAGSQPEAVEAERLLDEFLTKKNARAS